MLTPADSAIGESEEDTNLLREMALDAKTYLSSFSWCPSITAMYLAYGAGGIVAIFLAQFEEKIAQTDSYLWVVVGDLPSAYMVVEPHDSTREAIERYCQLMDGWINEILSFGDFSNVFPVDAPPTSANAGLLRARTDFIRREILPVVPAATLEILL